MVEYGSVSTIAKWWVNDEGLTNWSLLKVRSSPLGKLRGITTSVTYAQAIAKIRAIVHNSGSIIVNTEAGELQGGSGSGVARASTSGHDERA